MRRFAPGDSVAWRSVDHADRMVHTVLPLTVVRDEDDVVILYMPVGSAWRNRSGVRGGPRNRFLIEWDGRYNEDRVWRGTNVLMFHRLGDAHSIWLARDAETLAVAWWYVNLEEPWRRTPIGFDSRDRVLDLTLDPEGEWQWKDEDELEWAIANGRIDAQVAAGLRAEGERAKQRFARRDPPLDEPWTTWHPDVAWDVPVLPSGWRDYEPRP